ncbi:hypothetical protein PCANB_000231 [Pneumocystis canis]|nr:hypothetical protein PCANB_000231 [Pneumocystis canis]
MKYFDNDEKKYCNHSENKNSSKCIDEEYTQYKNCKHKECRKSNSPRNYNKFNNFHNLSPKLNNKDENKFKYLYSQKKLQSPKKHTEFNKPNFELSGRLAAESNNINEIPLKYYEPIEACKPDKLWQLYVFKNNEQIDILDIHQKSFYLLGRDRMVVDIPIDHPSCSKQHAVIQFRRIKSKNITLKEHIKPYIIDLESTNGTFLNNELILHSHYIELKPKDMIKFADSTREYILLHEDI